VQTDFDIRERVPSVKRKSEV